MILNEYDIIIIPQTASFGPEACEIGPKVVIWGIRRTGFPPEDSPLFYRAPKQGDVFDVYVFLLAGRTHAVNREFVYIDFDDERFPSCWRSLLEP